MGDTELSQFHILVVDNSEIERNVIETLLKSLSFHVTAVDSGAKALHFLFECEFEKAMAVNMIITDYSMPEMTGYDLLKKIMESPFYRRKPVVIMSSENDPSRMKSCLEEGAVEFLVKPLTLSAVNNLKPIMIKAKQVQDHHRLSGKQTYSLSTGPVESNFEIETSAKDTDLIESLLETSSFQGDTDSEFHVLVVDDSEIDRKMVEELLKSLSFKVTAVDSGTKAFAFLISCEFEKVTEVNMVITDYCMPKMTGYDLLQKIKESPFLVHIPVVIMSSEKVPSRITSCLEEGAEEFLLKPLTVSAVNNLRPVMIRTNQVQDHHQISKKQKTSASICAVESNLEIEKSAKESEFHVLVVDDSITDRELVESLLETSSFQVTTVDSGEKALQFLALCKDEKRVEVNLIITEFCMPEMSGYDLLKKLKISPSLKNIPVVVMSSHRVPSRILSWAEEGAEDFFLKPVTPSNVDKLRTIMVKAKQVQNSQASGKQGNSR